jgi:murein DD-endopeptidase MepM/ murein hydrolase activator NlpD
MKIIKTMFCLLMFAGIILAQSQVGRAEESCSKDVVCVETNQEGDTVTFAVRTMKTYPITLTLDITATNMDADVPLPYTATYPGDETTPALTLSVADSGAAWRWQYSYHWVRGILDAAHDDTYVYSLPYASGTAHKVGQGFNGTFSHYDMDQYCIDWNMDEGTEVLAARDGVVVAIEESFSEGGADESFKDYGNYVIIQHADDTIGEYYHFQHNGVQVDVGQPVDVGDVLGLSGNTGWSSGPHLHFGVYYAVDGNRRESVPIHFRTSDAEDTILEQGQTYTAP